MEFPSFVPAPKRCKASDQELLANATAFYQTMQQRRTIRDFSDRPVPQKVIEQCIRSAGTAPNGANLQPWYFVAISNPDVKREIRVAAEIEEWLAALAPLGTGSSKPFLETAPWIIAIFVQPYRILADGTRGKTYYAIESVGIATGLLVTAVHSCGLASLTHTPSPMGFLNRILGRPQHEKPFLLLVVGHPTNSAMVPNISRKSLEEISSFRT